MCVASNALQRRLFVDDGLEVKFPSFSIKLIQRSNILTSLIFNKGFGVFKVIGFNLLPKPAHKIKAVFILTTLPYKFWKIIF